MGGSNAQKYPSPFFPEAACTGAALVSKNSHVHDEEWEIQSTRRNCRLGFQMCMRNPSRCADVILTGCCRAVARFSSFLPSWVATPRNTLPRSRVYSIAARLQGAIPSVTSLLDNEK